MTQPLNIVHCFRSPVGGIFRHVRDLVKVQSQRGHKVGIICDSLTGSEYEDAMFDKMMDQLALGLVRFPMSRSIGPGDGASLSKTYKHLKAMAPDIIHAHGSKGGAYARLAGSWLGDKHRCTARLYCPHGGSIHFDPASLKGKIYFKLEQFLERYTDRLIFVSDYEKSGYHAKIGEPRCPSSLVYNGLGDEEFEPVGTADDGFEFLYIGMMRDLKGPDLFIEAFAQTKAKCGQPTKAHMVGDGPDKPRYIQQVKEMGLDDDIVFHDAMPARKAFRLARHIVVPSRAESMPYIVLEAIAAHKNVLATNVGGIPEIFDREPQLLIKPDSATALERAMLDALKAPPEDQILVERAQYLKTRFGVEVMADSVEAAYHACLK